jgi:transcriptional regulator with XRE-family HTH domain
MCSGHSPPKDDRSSMNKSAAKKMKQRSAGKPDIELGKRIRLRRVEQRISQAELGDQLGVSFQQVQKYEKGVNRVSFSALIKIAAALECRVADLVEDLDGPRETSTNTRSTREWLSQPLAVELLESFNKIKSKALRQAVLDLSRKLSNLD